MSIFKGAIVGMKSNPRAYGFPRDGSRRAFYWAFLFLLAALAVLSLSNWALAADEKLSFEVPSEKVWVSINQDSSLDFHYEIIFRNGRGSDPIEIVDIGMPTENYQLEGCSAAIDGRPLADLRESTVVSPGIEIHLGENAIKPGDEGRFEFHGNTPQMVFTDTEREGYASVEFKNTWWNPAYAHGKTYLTFSIQFPPGVKPNETIYHKEKYTSITSSSGSIVFNWIHPDAKPTEGYLHGVSFPAIYVSGVYPHQPPPNYEPVASTSGYGKSPGWLYVLPPIALVLSRLVVSILRVSKKGKKISYITPEVQVEGLGPMKELSAAEASVVMREDMKKIVAIAYMEMIRDGLVSIRGLRPLALERKGKPDKGLPAYYLSFLAAITPTGSLERSALKLAITTLIKSVENKTRGFSHAETVKYFQELSRESWIQVKSESDHRARVRKFEEKLPILLLEEDFSSQLSETFGAGNFPLDGFLYELVAPGGNDKSPLKVSKKQVEEALASGDVLRMELVDRFNSLKSAASAHTEAFEDEVVREVNPLEYRRVRGYGHPWLRQYGGVSGGGGCACACAGCACACAGGGR